MDRIDEVTRLRQAALQGAGEEHLRAQRERGKPGGEGSAGPVTRCLFCDAPLQGDGLVSGPGIGRHAYDPHLGRLWEICAGCDRWNPIPMEDRWEAIEAWEARVGRMGRPLLKTAELALVQVGEAQVVRVARPPLPDWGDWRYGTRVPGRERGRSALSRFFGGLLGRLPPPPLEGYDPYGLSGPMGGVAGRGGAREWLASPFLDRAHALTLAFTSFPFAPVCPSCGDPMPLNPWDFQRVTFRIHEGRVETEAVCARCVTEVLIALRAVRPALRMGLAVLDAGPEARTVGEEAGRRLDGVGGGGMLLRGLGRLGTSLGELDLTERVALGIVLDQAAEGDALEAEWREAEELAGIVEGELTEVPGFREFRERVLRRHS